MTTESVERFQTPTPNRSHGIVSENDDDEDSDATAGTEDSANSSAMTPTNGSLASSANDSAAVNFVYNASSNASSSIESEEDKEDEKEVEREEAEADKVETDDDLCTDDPVWTDADHDGCKVYGKYISDGTLSQEEACNYNDGAAKVHCRKTCESCEVKASTCEDKECIVSWKLKYGKCYGCSEFPNMCNVDPGFTADCPRTCGACEASESRSTMAPVAKVELTSVTTTTTTTNALAVPHQKCEDQACVLTWLQKKGKCFQCKDFADDFCGRDEDFTKSCPRTCKQCIPHEEPVCEDDFKPHTCKRHASWGWCSNSKIAVHCKASCGICAHLEAQQNMSNRNTTETHENSGASRPVVMHVIAVVMLLLGGMFAI
jgi:hypothetical protein